METERDQGRPRGGPATKAFGNGDWLANRFCPYIPPCVLIYSGGRNGFRTTRIWDGWPPAEERYERRWKRPVYDESSRRAFRKALRLKPKRPIHNRRAVGWLKPNKTLQQTGHAIDGFWGSVPPPA